MSQETAQSSQLWWRRRLQWLDAPSKWSGARLIQLPGWYPWQWSCNAVPGFRLPDCPRSCRPLFTTSCFMVLTFFPTKQMCDCSDLGLLINTEKSTLTPVQSIEFIGAVFNSIRARAFLPEVQFQPMADLISHIKSQLTTAHMCCSWWDTWPCARTWSAMSDFI